jgi:hypothetical protein
MLRIEIEADGYLVNPKQPYLPNTRTWREYLEDFYEFSTLSPAEQAALLDAYRLGPDDLENELPMEHLVRSYAHESRYASVFFALLMLKADVDAADVLEFIEGPVPLNSFRGVRLIGSKRALKDLFRRKGLDRKILLASHVESALGKAVTAAVKRRLKGMILEGEDDADRVDALLAIEAYIMSGCPVVDGLFMQLQYGSALERFPPESDVFQDIQSEWQK